MKKTEQKRKQKQGKIVELRGIKPDIIKRNKVEEALRESEERYRRLFEQSPISIGLNTTDGKIISCNKAAETITGYSIEELKKINLTELYENPEDRKVLLEVIRRDGGVVNYPVRLKRKDGTAYVALLNISRVHLDGEDLLQTILMDITEHKRAEMTLRASEKKFKDLAEITTDWVWEVDEDGIYTYVSPKVKELLGYEVSEVLGKTPFDLMPKKEAEKMAKFFEEKAVNKKPFYQLENVNRHKDGHLVVLETSGIPIFDKEGQLKGYRGIDRDITKRKHAERKLIKYQEQLKSLSSELLLTEERERHRLAVGIHDNISQNLALTKLALQSLIKSTSGKVPKGDETRLAGHSDISESLRKACSAIDQIIQDVHSLTFELSNPVLYKLGLEAAVKQYLAEQVEKKYDIKCKFTSEIQPIPLDNKLNIILFRDIRELLVNIVKYAKANTVEVRIQKADNKIQVIVKDNGVGLVPSKLGLSSPEYKLKGFGLFSIREQLECLGGAMTIKSTLGKGTCITLTVPLKCEETL